MASWAGESRLRGVAAEYGRDRLAAHYTAGMIDARIHADTVGAIVFDTAAVPDIDHAWFDPRYWQQDGRLLGHGGGRGAVAYLDTPAGACVLRHYHRGGMVAAVLGDRYLWTGRDTSRGFAEFRLLATLAGRGLPVPAPLAARYCRSGLYYRADLLTRRIDGAVTLAECLRAGHVGADRAREVGALVARFHREGVWHADLNAHNVLIGDDGLYLIDFDRGQLRAPAHGWQQSNLLRLRRSLLKLGAAGDGDDAFERGLWAPLMQGYERTLAA
jgi:3-deoxy-D-manno-octulosonic acid kinase